MVNGTLLNFEISTMVNGTLLNFDKRYYYDNLRVIFDQWLKLHFQNL